MNQVQEVLSHYPPSSVNNSRKIILEEARRFKEYPNSRSAAKLENFGFSVDYSDNDWGNEPPKSQYEVYDFKDLESTPEYHEIDVY